MTEEKLPFLKNASYNTIGVLINNICLWLTTLVVVRFSSDYVNAGVWQLSISITNIYATLAAFNLVSFYVSDVNGEYKTRDYLGTQILTCIVAAFMCVFYSVICGYKGTQLFCICVYMLVRVLEIVSGFMFGVDQRNYRMDYVGISNALRGVLSLLFFSLVLYWFNSLVLAVSSMIVVILVLLIVYDIPNAKRYEEIKVGFSIKKIRSIVENCTQSVLAIVLFTAVTTLPKQFLEHIYDSNAVGYYSTIAAPIVVIQVIIISIFSPLLRDVAELYKDGKFSELKSIAFKIVATLIGLALFCNLGAVFFGESVYGLLYGQSIKEYCYLIYAVIGCVILYAACWVCWTTLIAFRMTNLIAWFSAISLLIVMVFSRPIINYFGLNGVSFVTIAAYGIYLLLCVIYIFHSIKNQKERLNGTGD